MSSESDKQTKTTSTRREKAIAALFNDEPSKKPDKKNKKGIDKKTDKPREDEVESADMSITVSKKADTLQYQKLQLRDQILLRPDTYIGSVKTNLTPDPVYYLDDKTKMFKKGFLQLNDGLLRLFIEAISNAIDNVWRSVEFGIPVKFIKVTITKDKIGIWNDGRNITCATHPTEGIPIPEMIFGHLLTSSNYNDNEERKTSGKNGLGIKCLGVETIIPLFEGRNKLAKDIKVGDKLIGDDGKQRIVKNVVFGTGEMYEVSQSLGESYKVNGEHILSLHMPDHKVIFWNSTKNAWSVLWWDNETMSIKTKNFIVSKVSTVCPECDVELLSHLGRHMARCHPEVELVKERKSPINIPPISEEVETKRKEIIEFCKTIPDENTFDISVKDYMNLNNTTKLRIAGFRAQAIDYEKIDVALDPYILGLWLGDGLNTGRGFAINIKSDKEVIEYIQNWVSSIDATFKIDEENQLLSIASKPVKNQRRVAPLKYFLDKYGLYKNKRIPKEYILNDRETRLRVLAGFIDTDGTSMRDGSRIVITQCMEHKELVDDLVFLVRSLGFACSLTIKNTSWTYKGQTKKGKAFNINISGNFMEEIPTLLPRKKCTSTKSHNMSKTTGRIDVRKIDDGEFVGLEIDGNQRFAINDFTITHNCSNVFSRIFRIAIYNKSEKVVYTQEWNDNMKNCEEPVTVNKGFPKTAIEGSNGFTYVEFFPDFARFGMKEFDMDHIAMLRKITYDAAMTVSFHGVKVLLNEEEIPIHNVKEYVSHYFEGQLPEEHVLLNSQDCKVAIVGGDIDDFTQISFVNGIQTKDGGVHVDGWTKALFDGLSEKLSSKKMQITARDLKRHFFIYVFASLDKPAFNDQSKNKLNSPKVTVDLKQTVINKVAKWKFVEKIESSMKAKELTSLKETTERKRGRVVIRKLNEATLAGTKDSKDCILAITEGESAKGYVVSGIEYGVFGKKGNKYIGVMPIKGKFLNVKNAKLATLKDNEEVGALIKALGLQHGVDYTIEENRKKLRYGKFLMVADSDADGSHIAGLIYNFFHTLFPTLLEVPGFFNYMRTPILKIVKRNEKLAFFFLEQAHKYIESHKIGKEHIKYYKGLGTSNAEDIKEDFGRRIVSIVKDDKTDEMMEKVFATEHSDFRKNWIQEFTPRTEFPKLKDYEIEQLNASDFLNFEMILFSLADNARSIPKVLDGLKESQRKILYTAFHRNLNYESKSFKVAQFGASVAEQTNYHYGENSLFEAITKMAQNFAGSNNIPLLYADGNFGSRMGHLEKGVGGNAASPRYIFTKLECLTRLMFRPEDDDYLPNIEDEGAKIEKEYYLPIVPTALINGCEGIGSGWRSEVPMFNIIDIISWITAWLEGTGKPNLNPWYRGFKGEVSVTGKTVTTKGLLEEVSANVYRVTEIPIGLSIEKFLDKIKDFQEEGLVKDIVNNDNTSNTVDYTFKTTGDVDLKKLGLISTFSMNTMVFFDSKGKLKRYESVEEILEEFCVRRFEFYTVRKAGELRKMRHKLLVHEMKARFISDVLSGAIVLRGKDEDVLSAELEKKAYAKVDGDYDYLLTIQVRSMTAKRVEQLHESIAEIKAKIKEYESKSEKSLWVDELKELVAAYQKSYFVAEPTVKKATIAKKR